MRMLRFIRSVQLLAGGSEQPKDILISSRIEAIEESESLSLGHSAEVINGEELIALPGFIDSHVHITGGGGEGGFKTRTPEIMLTDLTRAGITTVIGTLGTDGTTRTMSNLIAKCYGLREEGISAWCYTGNYHLPVRTTTGSVTDDIILIDPIIGTGEIALSDHRSSQPTREALAALAAEARVGGILSAKAGVVNVHMGDGPRMLDYLRWIATETEIPKTQFIPTHINRNQELLKDGITWAKEGGLIDFTTSSVPLFIEEGEEPAALALAHALEAGVPAERVSFTSDGNGSLPQFNADGQLTGLSVGSPSSLYAAVREAVLSHKVPLAEAIKAITSTPAENLKLSRKGKIAPGMDADLVLIRKDDLSIHSVIAGGEIMVNNGTPLITSTFE